MISMDVKGITWVGNIYQKFEAMCLEVEETMYEDTVKYVENQVQTVGSSVKKFCSDVMQDLLPPSSMDPVKVAVSELPVAQYADVGICKKPKVGVKEKPFKVDTGKLIAGSKAIPDVGKNGCHEPSPNEFRNVNNLFPPSSMDSVEGTYSDLYPRQHDDGSTCNKSKLCVKENYEKDCLPATEMPGEITPADKDLSRAGFLYENHEVSCDQTALTSTPAPVEVKGCDFIEESCNEIENTSKSMSDVSINSPLSDTIILVESVGNRGMEMNLPSSGGLSAVTNGAADICTNNGMASLVGSSGNGNASYKEFSGKVFVSHPASSADWGSGMINTVAGEGRETNDVKLEESCVLVNGDELHFVSHRGGKRKPYKKKIQDAFSSRMRTARKQEYKELAVWHGDGAKSNQECMESLMSTPTVVNKKGSPTRDLCESEWELL